MTFVILDDFCNFGELDDTPRAAAEISITQLIKGFIE
jgi:hypothetical protein